MSLPREKVSVFLSAEVHEAMKHISEVDGSDSMQKWCEEVVTAEVVRRWLKASSLARRLGSIDLSRHAAKRTGINRNPEFQDTDFGSLGDAETPSFR